MPKQENAISFMLTVIALGAVTTMTAATHWTGFSPLMLQYVAHAALASTLKVRIPGVRGTFSANCIVTALAIAHLAAPQLVFVSIVCGVVQCCWRAAQRPSVAQIAFNAGVFAISAAVSAWTYEMLTPLAPNISGVAAFAVASCVFFLINTGLISVLLALIDGVSLRGMWRIWSVWSSPYYLLNLAAATLIIAFAPLRATLAALIAISMLALFLAYRRLINNMAAGSAAAS